MIINNTSPNVCFAPYKGSSIVFEAFYGKHYVSMIVPITLITNINIQIDEIRHRAIVESLKEEEERSIA